MAAAPNSMRIMRWPMIASAEIADSRTNALDEARKALLYQSSLQTGRLDSTHRQQGHLGQLAFSLGAINFTPRWINFIISVMHECMRF